MADRISGPMGGGGENGSEPEPKRGLTRVEWAVVAGLLALGVVLGLVLRPSGEAPWDDKAIAAEFQTLTIQKAVGPEEAGQTPGDVHVVVRYRLRNATDQAYQVPEPKHGVLMRSMAAGGAWQEVDSVLWNQHLTIPARQAAEVEFDMAIPSTDEDAPEDPQEQQDVVAAGMARLRPIRELVFVDYAHRYVIHLPRGWE